MRQEFITVRGKVIVENGMIRIKNLKVKNRSDLYYYAFFILLFSTIIKKDSKVLPLAYFGLGILGLLMIIWFLEGLFINSWKNRIPLSSIRSYKVTYDDAGLETCVVIYTSSGRRKEIIFRTLEKQYDAFLEILSQQVTQPLIAS